MIMDIWTKMERRECVVLTMEFKRKQKMQEISKDTDICR